jgi:hypothetical protein
MDIVFIAAIAVLFGLTCAYASGCCKLEEQLGERL